MTDRPRHTTHDPLLDDERALSALARPDARARPDDHAVASAVTASLARRRSRRARGLVFALVGATGAAVVGLSLVGLRGASPSRPAEAVLAAATALDDASPDADDAELLSEALDDDAVAIASALFATDGLDDDTLVALGPILDARLARAETR